MEVLTALVIMVVSTIFTCQHVHLCISISRSIPGLAA